MITLFTTWFESFVNSERCKTLLDMYASLESLRALLIQKDVKHTPGRRTHSEGLRALLIQKDVKLHLLTQNLKCRLRALLIQKDVKPCSQSTSRLNV